MEVSPDELLFEPYTDKFKEEVRSYLTPAGITASFAEQEYALPPPTTSTDSSKELQNLKQRVTSIEQRKQPREWKGDRKGKDKGKGKGKEKGKGGKKKRL